jgi:hypothetical protein
MCTSKSKKQGARTGTSRVRVQDEERGWQAAESFIFSLENDNSLATIQKDKVITERTRPLIRLLRSSMANRYLFLIPRWKSLLCKKSSSKFVQIFWFFVQDFAHQFGYLFDEEVEWQDMSVGLFCLYSYLERTTRVLCTKL